MTTTLNKRIYPANDIYGFTGTLEKEINKETNLIAPIEAFGIAAEVVAKELQIDRRLAAWFLDSPDGERFAIYTAYYLRGGHGIEQAVTNATTDCQKEMDDYTMYTRYGVRNDMPYWSALLHLVCK